MMDDGQAIRAAVQTYLDGLYEGDADKLAAVFHPTSALTQWQDGELKIVPRDAWLDAVRNRPSPQARGLARARGAWREGQVLRHGQAVGAHHLHIFGEAEGAGTGNIFGVIACAEVEFHPLAGRVHGGVVEINFETQFVAVVGQ